MKDPELVIGVSNEVICVTTESQNQTFFHDAFIVFDHAVPDRMIAGKLQKSLLSYRTPRVLVKEGKLRKLDRIILDPESKNGGLSDAVKSALIASRFLIVVCSPRSLRSGRIEEIIAFYGGLGRRDHVLALLIEGKPQDSFPALLQEERRTKVADADGNLRELVEIVEPLAADIRDHRLHFSPYLLATEKLRLLAPMIGCEFRDLKPVHLEEQRKSYILTTVGIVWPLLVFSVASLYWRTVAVNETRAVNETKRIAEQQIVLAQEALHKMYFDIPERLKDNPEALANVTKILNDNLELVIVGKQVDKAYDRFLVIRSSDDENAVTIKARILCKLGRSDEAVAAWDYYKQHFAKSNEQKLYVEIAKKFASYACKSGLSGGIYIEDFAEKRAFGYRKGPHLERRQIIIAINGIPMNSLATFNSTLRKLPLHHEIRVKVIKTQSDGSFSRAEFSVPFHKRDLGIVAKAI